MHNYLFRPPSFTKGQILMDNLYIIIQYDHTFTNLIMVHNIHKTFNQTQKKEKVQFKIFF